MSMDDESGTRAKMQAATLEIDGKVYKLELAKIEGTMFGWEDHGILTAMLTLDYLAGSFQGAGGDWPHRTVTQNSAQVVSLSAEGW